MLCCTGESEEYRKSPHWQQGNRGSDPCPAIHTGVIYIGNLSSRRRRRFEHATGPGLGLSVKDLKDTKRRGGFDCFSIQGGGWARQSGKNPGIVSNARSTTFSLCPWASHWTSLSLRFLIWIQASKFLHWNRFSSLACFMILKLLTALAGPPFFPYLLISTVAEEERAWALRRDLQCDLESVTSLCLSFLLSKIVVTSWSCYKD